MRNRAKCKKCNDVIESFHSSDYVECKCGSIGLDGGIAMKCFAKDWEIFRRVDDHDNEIIPTIKDKDSEMISTIVNNTEKPSKKEMLSMLKDMITSIESLPSNAMSQPITHYDYLSLLLLISAILSSDCNEES